MKKFEDPIEDALKGFWRLPARAEMWGSPLYRLFAVIAVLVVVALLFPDSR
jgi:hypothetical protein